MDVVQNWSKVAHTSFPMDAILSDYHRGAILGFPRQGFFWDEVSLKFVLYARTVRLLGKGPPQKNIFKLRSPCTLLNWTRSSLYLESIVENWVFDLNWSLWSLWSLWTNYLFTVQTGKDMCLQYDYLSLWRPGSVDLGLNSDHRTSLRYKKTQTPLTVLKPFIIKYCWIQGLLNPKLLNIGL